MTVPGSSWCSLIVVMYSMSRRVVGGAVIATAPGRRTAVEASAGRRSAESCRRDRRHQRRVERLAPLGYRREARYVRVDAVIVAVGLDVVGVDRFVQALSRTPALAERLFTVGERVTGSGDPRSAASLAARFAAKEALAKALGAPAGLRWHDCEVVTDAAGRPWLTVTGSVAEAASRLAITRWHLSLSHDGGIASAMVVAEGEG